MVGEVKDLLEVNPVHYLCKKVKELQTYETILFFLCVTKYVDFGDLCVLDNEYQFMFPIKELSKIRSDIMSRRSPLFRDKLLSEAHDSGFASREGIAVSEEIKEYLDEELQLNWIVSEEKPIEGLLTHETILQKHLYYNNEEQVAIEKLFKMLHNDHFTAIQERMTASGIRSGFACLFYGAPGTGKTETVLQLARETGRDIMQVNVASIRSKWVGDSEKNIRNIFKRYKNYCAKRKVKPILLFNEADAIINKRSTNVERSVDKMENAVQNIILEEMENLDGILIATTNLTSNIDTAFERRFIYKVEFHKPGVATKKHIWQSMINELNDSDAQTLASEFDLSGGQIENVMRKQFVDKILYDEAPTLEKLRNYCTQESMTSSSPHRTTIGFK
jgi:ATP-dependent Clp protease ATP-binding subunit ClpA